MLLYRFLSALVIVPVSLAAIWFGDPWFSMLIALAALLGAFEFYQIGRASCRERV
jgi:CDP-diglyceride synthetase